MRVIFQTPPTAMTIGRRDDGRQGRAYLRVIQFDPNEEPPPVPNANVARTTIRRLADLRREAGLGKPIIAAPVPSGRFAGRLAPVVIPEAVLAGLPDDSKLQFVWTYEA